MSNVKRATGRTFRILNEAIGKASDGINVVVVLESEFYAADCRRRVYDMIDAYNPKVVEQFGSNLLLFPNGAFIGFAATGYNVGSISRNIIERNNNPVITLTDHGLI